jgi:peroxiredoxin
MRIAISAALVLLLSATSISSAQNEATVPSTAEAEALLKDVAQSYKKAPALTDTIKLKISAGGRDQTEIFTIALGSGTDARLQVPDLTIRAVDGKMYVVRETLPQKYVQRDIEGNVLATFDALVGGRRVLPLPQAMLRYGSGLDAYVAALGMGMEEPRLTGLASVERDGRPLKELQLASGTEVIRIHVDPASKMIVGAEFNAGRASVKAAMSPKVHDALPEPIAFDTQDRKRVESLDELTLGAGDPAPDFTLTSTTGETVALKDLAGNVVVLDFWATWCGWCVKGMPLLEQFHEYAKTSGEPIKVYAVNVWERVPDDQRAEKAAEFWAQKGWSIPVLIDAGNTLIETYGFSGIPATVVIGPDGRIANIHNGYDPKMFETLKVEAAKALETEG